VVSVRAGNRICEPSHGSRWLLGLVSLAAGIVAPSHAKAEELPPLEWRWSKFGTGDIIVTGAAGAITVLSAVIVPRSQHAPSGGYLFDDGVRSALRADDVHARLAFRDASNLGLSLMVAWPFLTDALTTAWWHRGSQEVAEQMALIDLETFAITGALQGATNVIVSRERPYGADCGSDALPENTL